ncbi:hypothetical protein K438DRAFT_1860280, partial [Mycena galopus ATCC 62051]
TSSRAGSWSGDAGALAIFYRLLLAHQTVSNQLNHSYPAHDLTTILLPPSFPFPIQLSDVFLVKLQSILSFLVSCYSFLFYTCLDPLPVS